MLIITLLISLLFFIQETSFNDLKEIKKFLNDNLSGKLYHSINKFKKKDKPIISIVISTFNGEIYLKPAVRSIQNQNFLNIEIIIVDDGSLDNSVKIINELMKEDPRIKLIKNYINRGTLYTKTKGVLNAKGKYVMTLDHDNLYANKKAFVTLYNEAEKYNLDLLGFSSIIARFENKNLTIKKYLNFCNTTIIKLHNITNRFFVNNYEHIRTYLYMFFIKTDIFINSINKLGNEFINRNIDAHDDTILIFILSKNALTLKHIKKILYITLKWPKQYGKSLTFQQKIKYSFRESKNCFSFLTYFEVLLLFTENNHEDKKIAEYSFLDWLTGNLMCLNKTNIKNDILRISNLYLKNEYISKNAKNEILLYLNKSHVINSNK